MNTSSIYTIKDIPETLCTMNIRGVYQQAFKAALSDYLEKEYSDGYALVGIDFHCHVAIFRYFIRK